MMHPINNTNIFKAFVHRHNIAAIIGFFLLAYLILSMLFSLIYCFMIADLGFMKGLEYSIMASFGFGNNVDISTTDLFFIVHLIHRILSMIVSTIFTAVIVLKYFSMPTFFVFKEKCNYIEDEGVLIITLYNSIDIFVTNCHIRVYAREEGVDEQGKKALKNINNNEALCDKTFPFMEQNLVTRLRINYGVDSVLGDWRKLDANQDKKMDLIILIEAKANNLDSAIYEVHKYTIDMKHVEDTIDFKPPHSIDLDFEDFSKSAGWEKFND